MKWTPSKTDPKVLEALIWAEVARAFKAGATGAELCRRFGFSASTFYAHAKAGGWQQKQMAAQAELASEAEEGETPRTGADQGGVLGGLALREDTLEQDAAELARRALARVAAGDGKGADAALKAADRLLRIKRRLGSEPDTSSAEAALGRLMAMSDGELEGEIKRLAGASEG
ncbi:MAG: hypothetical protein ABJG15_02050 [Hyphomonadaceae bacterium]